jgi:hypothetical protein
MALEDVIPDRVKDLQTALYNIGMGCQITDDMVDVAADMKKKRHNFIVSLIWHEGGPADQSQFHFLMAAHTGLGSGDHPLLPFPRARASAEAAARRSLQTSLCSLFARRANIWWNRPWPSWPSGSVLTG